MVVQPEKPGSKAVDSKLFMSVEDSFLKGKKSIQAMLAAVDKDIDFPNTLFLSLKFDGKLTNTNVLIDKTMTVDKTKYELFGVVTSTTQS